MTFLINTPYPVHCWVRNEYLHNLERGSGVTEAYWIAVRCIPGRALGCQLVLKNGAQWAEIPLNALMHQPGAPHHRLGFVQPWDCFSHQACAVVLDYLRSMRVLVAPGGGLEPVYGRYLFTIDWAGDGFAEVPEQHKNHHVIALEDGSIVAYPNNRTVWHDACWIEPMTEKPGYINNFHAWSGEYEAEKA